MRNAKIADLESVVFGDHDVGGLEVPVDDAVWVQIFQGMKEVDEEFPDFHQRKALSNPSSCGYFMKGVLTFQIPLKVSLFTMFHNDHKLLIFKERIKVSDYILWI